MESENWINKNKNSIIQGDVLNVLKTFPDECVDMIMTSPPYYGMRDYETAQWQGGCDKCDHKIPSTETDPKNPNGTSHNIRFIRDTCYKCGAKRIDSQIGLEKSLSEYLDKMLLVTAELQRVLKKEGTMWWNHGDSYGGPIASPNSPKLGARAEQRICSRPAIGADKCLVMQNYRLAARMCDEQKWILRNIIVWHKLNAMPSSVKDRFTIDYEPIFFFSKNKKYYFEQQLDPCCRNTDVEYRRTLRRKNAEQYNLKKPYKNNFPKSFNNQGGRNKRCVWPINTKPFKESHFATFPPALIDTPIKAGCPEFICSRCGKPREKIYEKGELISSGPNKMVSKPRGFAQNNMIIQDLPPDPYGDMPKREKKFIGYSDCGCNAGFTNGIVLDPFGGSMTTAIVARQLNRNFIGIELNQKYIDIANKRLSQQMLNL